MAYQKKLFSIPRFSIIALTKVSMSPQLPVIIRETSVHIYLGSFLYILILKPFQSNVAFLYPLKTSRFQGVQKCDTGLRWVNHVFEPRDFLIASLKTFIRINTMKYRTSFEETQYQRNATIYIPSNTEKGSKQYNFS